MRKSALFLGLTVAITLLFYLLAYFLLPPPPPSAALMLLFAGLAVAIVWLLLRPWRRGRGNGKSLLLVISLGCCLPVALGQQTMSNLCRFTKGPRAGTIDKMDGKGRIGTSCTDGFGNEGFIVPTDEKDKYYDRLPDARPPHVDSKVGDKAADSVTVLNRVTGIALLVRGEHELVDFGLYSYALLTRPPQGEDLPKYRAFLTALIERPSAKDLTVYLSHQRINITYLPVTLKRSDWETLSVKDRVEFVLTHYDYARASAIVAALPKRPGPGPVIISVLKPLSVETVPHPVLVQDLTTAQPDLMASYVNYFVDQAAKDHFWEAQILSQFCLSLRNGLETAAVGLGMSRDAVKNWVEFTK
jgi:hypothetical protein